MTHLRPATIRCLVAAVLLGVCLPALAHSGAGVMGGFLAGFLHPVSGLDHLLAMVAVGIWGATLGQPLLIALPVAFPLLMVVGGVLGIAGIPIPLVEIGVGLSVVVLGIAIALAWRAPVPVALIIVGFFGIYHGHAHGTELPSSAAPAAYAAGFVLCTGLLHLTGIALGLLKALKHGDTALRCGGGAIACTGVWILLGMPGVA
ncbi:MAG TPA: HupE/UreJ family protein [Rhodocyclaceae bacterium]